MCLFNTSLSIILQKKDFTNPLNIIYFNVINALFALSCKILQNLSIIESVSVLNIFLL
jgi:hypothetical protein